MKPFKELRQDPHRPSAMDPADYVFVGAADDHPGDSYMEINHTALARYGVETGSSDRYSHANVPFYDATEDGRPNFRCHHCGKHGSNIRYFCFFLHKPSKQVIVVGQICAKKLSLGSREELDFQKRADDFRRMQQRHRWVDDHQDEYNFLKDYNEHHARGGKYVEFLESLWDQIQARGSLSDRQLEALHRWMSRPQDWTRQTQPQSQDADRHQAVVTHTDEPPTDKQIEYIEELATGPITWPTTRIEASDLINRLKAAKQMSTPQTPQEHTDAPATEKQISYINSLMDGRTIPVDKRREARQWLDDGITRKQASAAIEKLLTYPKIEES